MQKLFLSFLLVSAVSTVLAQTSGMGYYEPSHSECISEANRAILQQRLEANRIQLIQEGLLSAEHAEVNPVFIWPVINWGGNTDSVSYAISSFVDQNPAVNNQISDYNCGNRSYDTPSGYNHQGTDIFTWPFGWLKMDFDHVAARAAAAGIIVDKNDGAFDRNCAMNNNPANFFAIEHGDGSVAYYYHLKNGSLNNKAIGQTVTAGEFLGIVGSSGSSTGPHLHFEVWDATNSLIDPYAGNCNTWNLNSWWASQLAYENSKLHSCATHSALPDFGTCPQQEIPYAKDTFCLSDEIYLMGYSSELAVGSTIQVNVRNANNNLIWNGPLNVNTFYQASYWYYHYNDVQTVVQNPGTYKLSYVYNGTSVESIFYVLAPLGQPAVIDMGNNLLSASLQGSYYQWYENGNLLPNHTQTITGNLGSTYTVIVQDACSISPISAPYVLANAGVGDIAAANLKIVNPVKDQIQVISNMDLENTPYDIYSISGQRLTSGIMNSNFIPVDFPAGVYVLKIENAYFKIQVI